MAVSWNVSKEISRKITIPLLMCQLDLDLPEIDITISLLQPQEQLIIEIVIAYALGVRSLFSCLLVSLLLISPNFSYLVLIE